MLGHVAVTETCFGCVLICILTVHAMNLVMSNKASVNSN